MQSRFGVEVLARQSQVVGHIGGVDAGVAEAVVGGGPHHAARSIDQALGRAQMIVEVPVVGGADFLEERVGAPALSVDLTLAYFKEQLPIGKSTNSIH
jgi:hypothetical protein